MHACIGISTHGEVRYYQPRRSTLRYSTTFHQRSPEQQSSTVRFYYTKKWGKGVLYNILTIQCTVDPSIQLEANQILLLVESSRKAQPPSFWDTIYFYTASATVGNQSSIVPRETSHHERDGLMTTCGCLFGIVCLNKTRALERFRNCKVKLVDSDPNFVKSQKLGLNLKSKIS